MTGADSRPRVHITLSDQAAEWSFGPCAQRHPTPDPGAALNCALERLGDRAGKGVVVIVEPRI